MAQSGSGWIRGGSSTCPCSGPSRTLGKRGKQRMAAGPPAGGTCAFIKLKEEGIEVIKTLKLRIEPNEINKKYLKTKKERSNHIFD